MRDTAVADLDTLLARKSALAASGGATPEFAARLRELRTWQSARLARTYADLQRDARCAPAVEFFLTDLYGAADFVARDQEITRAWRYLRRSLPATARDALARAIELEVLTAELDQAMVAALPAGPITAATYAQAYRAVGQRANRERQIELVLGAGESLDRSVRHLWIGALLSAAHGPAHAAGFGVLQDFLERGYDAFRRMGSARELLAAIRERETQLMQALFAGEPDPFAALEHGAQ